MTSNPVMIGVVNNWTRSNRGPSTFVSWLSSGEPDEDGRTSVEDSDASGTSSCRLCFESVA